MLTRQSIKYPVLVAIHCPYRCSYCMALHCMTAHRIASHRTASHLGKSGSGRKGMFLLGFCNCLFLLLSVVQRLNTIKQLLSVGQAVSGVEHPTWGEKVAYPFSLELQRKGRENTTTPPGLESYSFSIWKSIRLQLPWRFRAFDLSFFFFSFFPKKPFLSPHLGYSSVQKKKKKKKNWLNSKFRIVGPMLWKWLPCSNEFFMVQSLDFFPACRAWFESSLALPLLRHWRLTAVGGVTDTT